MDPISAVLQNFDFTVIKLAGAAVITLVITYVSIQKVAGLVRDEGKEDVVINGYAEELNKGSYEGQREDEKYEYFIMDNVAEYKLFSDEDWERLSHLKEKYGQLTAEEFNRFNERCYKEEADYFDEDD